MNKEKDFDDQPVPYILYESEMTRHERTIKRLVIAVVVAISLMFVSNLAWLYAWNSYDYVSSETSSVTVDGKDGIANYIGNDGDITNGEGGN
jgi:hypothetical protein